LIVGNWNAFLAPAGTPAAVIDRLHDAIVEVGNEPGMIASVHKAGAEIDFSSNRHPALASCLSMIFSACLRPPKHQAKCSALAEASRRRENRRTLFGIMLQTNPSAAQQSSFAKLRQIIDDRIYIFIGDGRLVGVAHLRDLRFPGLP